jgi:hypothetical protein
MEHSRDRPLMPYTRVYEPEGGIKGHQKCKLTDWDYDRLGDQYQITCECGKKLARTDYWARAVDSFKAHIRSVQETAELQTLGNRQLAKRLRERYDASIDKPNPLLLEAVRRLNGGKQKVG